MDLQLEGENIGIMMVVTMLESFTKIQYKGEVDTDLRMEDIMMDNGLWINTMDKGNYLSQMHHFIKENL